MEALDSGKLGAYICDFPTNAVKNHPKIVALPHLGASTGEAEENCAIMVADTLKRLPRERQHPQFGEFPEAVLPRTHELRPAWRSPTRTCRTWSARSRRRWPDAKLNIADLLNKSRGELAYTLIDVDGQVPAGVLDQLRKIEGVLNVRAL